MQSSRHLMMYSMNELDEMMMMMMRELKMD